VEDEIMGPPRWQGRPIPAAVAALLLAALLVRCGGPQPLPPEILYPAELLEERGIQDGLLAERRQEEALARAAERLSVARSPLNLILAARVERDKKTALALLDEALQEDPASVWARYGIAFLVFKMKDFDRYEDSAKHLEWILDRGFGKDSPVPVCPHRLLIEIMSGTSRYDEAKEQWMIYLAAHPDDLDARYDLAWLLYHRLDSAEKSLEQVRLILEAEPRRLDARLLEGCVLRSLGEFNAAVRAFKSIEDRHPDALLNVAELYDQDLGRPAEALSHYRRYQEYTGENEDQRRAVDRYFRIPPRIEELEKKLEEKKP